MDAADVKVLTQALAAPFDPKEVKFKPSVVKGDRAMALAYVDARVIQDRLDAVLGVEGWQDDYENLPDGSVVCRLRLKLGDEWVTKVDVGGQSEQPDGGDRMKSAFSDALKRAAVKFGVGRYLYRLPAQWVGYDPQKRQFKKMPQLPAFALPPGRPAPASVPSTQPGSFPPEVQSKAPAVPPAAATPEHGQTLQHAMANQATGPRATPKQHEAIVALLEQVGVTTQRFVAALPKEFKQADGLPVTAPGQLTADQADLILLRLRRKLAAKLMRDLGVNSADLAALPKLAHTDPAEADADEAQAIISHLRSLQPVSDAAE